VTLQSSDFTSP